MALYLAAPARQHRRAWYALKREFGRDDAVHFALYQGSKTYGQFLRKWRDFHTGRHLPDHYVPGTKYFLLEEGSPKILGVIDIRHRLNDHLLNNPGGHIGYAVAPSERRRGYGTQQLRLALEKCREMGISPVLVTCHKDNVASAKVIQKNGGVLEDERVSAEGKAFQRYWITL
ncbi:MAG: GNAT family N-acetyltransferase [Oscillospiraceae bacterium]|nr:GNAT family N-acetyltransferase [Oscillospiraceae bacterium]